MPKENHSRRKVLVALGTLLTATALLVLFAAPATSTTPLAHGGSPVAPRGALAPASYLSKVAPAVVHPATVIGPIHGKYYVQNTSLPAGTSNYGVSNAVDPVTQTVYSDNLFGGTITAFSESTGQVERSVTVGDIQFGILPYALVFDSRSNTLFVAVLATPSGWVLELNATTFSQIANISTAGAPSGHFEPFIGGAYDTASNQVFFSNQSDGELLAINAATDHVTFVACPAAGCARGLLLAVPQLGELVETTGTQYLVVYNTSTDNPVATLTLPVATALTVGSAYIPASETLVVGNESSAPSTVFFEYNLSTRVYLGTLGHCPSSVVALVYDAAHNDILATGTNGSRYVIAVNAASDVVDGLYQEAPNGLFYYALSLDAPANVVIATGFVNNSSIALRLPSLTPVIAYSSFPLEQVAVAVDPVTGTIYTLGIKQSTLRATSESTGATLWTEYQRFGTTLSDPDALAVDATTDTLYVIAGGTGHIEVLNGSTGTVVTRLFLGHGVNGTTLALDPTAHLLYVAQDNQTVSIWSTTTHALLGSVIIAGFSGCGGAASLTLHYAYFTNCNVGGNVTTVSGLTYTRGTIYGTGATPEGIAIDGGGILYAVNAGSRNVTRINTATSTETTPLSLGSYQPLQAVVDSADGILAVTSIQSTSLELIDPSTGILLAAPNVGSIGFSAAFDVTSGTFVFPQIVTGVTVKLTPLSAPSVPTGLSASAGNTTLLLGWAPVASGGSGVNYTVSLATSLSGPWGNNHTLAGTTYTYSGLTDGTTYFVTVTASNLVGVGPTSAAVNATPLGVPYPPVSVVATGASNASINVSWVAPASTGGSPVTNYTLKWALAGSASWTSVSEGTALAATVSGLHPVSNYTVFVVAWNKVGGSNASAKATAETKATPPAPPSKSTSSSGNNLLYYLIAGVVVAAVIAALALLMMRRKRPSGVQPYQPGPAATTPGGPSPPPPPPGATPWAEEANPAPPPGVR
ncbi:MAG: fibronectin type III domain-containing protein [Thermoplasmata archaeon]|nr:fibronectin type III domain-containing protein [Thermoplasmata archaeon]